LASFHPEENLAGSSSALDKIRFYTGGEKGVLKIWDGREGAVVFTLGQEDDNISDDQEEQRQICRHDVSGCLGFCLHIRS